MDVRTCNKIDQNNCWRPRDFYELTMTWRRRKEPKKTHVHPCVYKQLARAAFGRYMVGRVTDFISCCLFTRVKKKHHPEAFFKYKTCTLYMMYRPTGPPAFLSCDSGTWATLWQRWRETTAQLGRDCHMCSGWKRNRGQHSKANVTLNLCGEEQHERLIELPGRGWGWRRGTARAEVGTRVCTPLHCLQTPFCSQWDWLMPT